MSKKLRDKLCYQQLCSYYKESLWHSLITVDGAQDKTLSKKTKIRTKKVHRTICLYSSIMSKKCKCAKKKTQRKNAKSAVSWKVDNFCFTFYISWIFQALYNKHRVF